jgi:ADP-ribose pyrophosphatase YjhB (NUDIX family)
MMTNIYNNSNINNYNDKYINNSWKLTKNKNLFCNNCGMISHIAKKCLQPISSYGLVILKFKHKWLDKYSNEIIKNFFLDTYSSKVNEFNKKKDIDQYLIRNYNNNKKKEDINDYYNAVVKNIDFCMIQRKYTVNYIQLIRGQYNELEIDDLRLLFSRLTKEELTRVRTVQFDELWQDLWEKKSSNTDFLSEYHISKEKFLFINNFLKNFINDIESLYEHPEWEFPKGRRNDNESDFDCAIREFEEETGINKNNIHILDKLNPIIEDITGSNNKKYKMTYFIGILINDDIEIKLDDTNIFHKIEVSDIKFLSHNEAYKNIRDFHIEKINIINSLIDFILYNIRYYDKFYKKNNIFV